ncbi:MAG: photosystem reaction center subunit, partial [Microbacteriaceae bacterium]|nr:photosystem reaction center subunit [Microbacteriaceae bacterium]
MIDTNNLPGLIGAKVIDKDGDKVGSAGQIYVDTTTGEPNWVSVNTGLFGTSESFVPLHDANVRDDQLVVNYDKAFVKDAPRVDADGELSPEDERRLYDYYSMGSSYDTDGRTDGTYADTDTQVGGTYVDTDHRREGTYADTDTDTDTDAGAGTGARGGPGYDTSGPTTDDAMTRSEERLHVGTESVQTGRARLRKYVVTENQSVTVPVTREEVRLEREPITDANIGDATSGPDISEEEHEVTLTEERVVVDKETVPVERVRLDKETVTEQQQVNEQVRKEE